MTDHVVAALCGLLGGSVPAAVHLALNACRKNHMNGGTLDLTYRGRLK
jgi:hypothetical protein